MLFKCQSNPSLAPIVHKHQNTYIFSTVLLFDVTCNFKQVREGEINIFRDFFPQLIWDLNLPYATPFFKKGLQMLIASRATKQSTRDHNWLKRLLNTCERTT